MIKALRILIKDVCFYSSIFGFVNALKLRVVPKICETLGLGTYYHFYNKTMILLLKEEFKDIIDRYRQLKKNIETPFSQSSIIWVCWWQGEDQMPQMIKQCYYSLCKNSNGHQVVLLTNKNYMEYISLPEIVLEKHKKGLISTAHLSDVLRLSLLSKYGGLWIDSTYWVTLPIDIDGKYFYSIKQEIIKEANISGFLWTCHLMGCGSPYLIYAFCAECMIRHISIHVKIAHYLMQDYIIRIAYDEFPEFRQIIDELPYLDDNIYYCQDHFNDRITPEIIEQVISTRFHKLNRGGVYKEITVSGEPTLFSFFMNWKVTSH